MTCLNEIPSPTNCCSEGFLIYGCINQEGFKSNIAKSPGGIMRRSNIAYLSFGLLHKNL